jgi:hypothetical protein
VFASIRPPPPLLSRFFFSLSPSRCFFLSFLVGFPFLSALPYARSCVCLLEHALCWHWIEGGRGRLGALSGPGYSPRHASCLFLSDINQLAMFDSSERGEIETKIQSHGGPVHSRGGQLLIFNKCNLTLSSH